jgi:threonine dehydrogenase-like Zn-dependent dehydrogenase
VIPAFNAFKIPDNISDDLASIFDPFGNAVHTALSSISSVKMCWFPAPARSA